MTGVLFRVPRTPIQPLTRNIRANRVARGIRSGGMRIQSLPHVLAHREPVRSPGPPHGQEAVPQVSSETPDLKNRPRFAHEPGGIGKKGFFGNPKKDGGGDDCEGLIPSSGVFSTA